ncbi:MAG: phenylalanine--tRNA ligase subunit beta [Peptococcaceae bacterium]|jgi:phenylalanyl-tRNA synthetase beta chain|nr:phenylalanine--tRNA ligase subunit beta [Peptococcaceae bacterium]
MKVSYKWLKELVDIDLTPEEAAATLTKAGLEVEGVEYLDQGVKNVVTGRVLSVEPHPQADKLVVTQVDTGGDKPLTIVTGAPNVKVGQCVPVALVGAKLPSQNHPEIQLTKLRGVLSEGMMCGADEIGLDPAKLTPEEKDGLYPLPPDTPLGLPIVEYLGLDDVVLDIGLTPNRADCMGMINVAREMAALTGAKLTLPPIKRSAPGGECSSLATGLVEEGDALCYRFGMRLVKEVKVGPSPQWMRQRLMAMGMRSINNVVDISNIVMLEMNRPLHFFDFDKLEGGGVWIRRAKPGEKIETLDGQDRELSGTMTLVTDQAGPVAIAGVMGGARTEVTDTTSRILIEAACWNGPAIRRTCQALGLRSEASQRFEKEVDVQATIEAIDRAVELIEGCGAGMGVEGHIDLYPNPVEPHRTWVSLSKINNILGVEVAADEAAAIWKGLQITIVDEEAGRWLLEAPSWRKDLRIEEDYAEEVARLYGYDKISDTLPSGPATQGYRLPMHQMRRVLTQAMIGQGYREVVNYSFINPGNLDKLDVPEGHPWRRAVTLMNPLSEEQGIMRTTVLPSMIQRAAYNIHQRNYDLRIFEMGKVYLTREEDPVGQPDERWTLAAVCTGVSPKTWLEKESPMDFYTLKGAVEAVLAAVGIAEPLFIPAVDIPGLHPGRAARILCGDEELGYIGEVSPRAAEAFDVGQRLTAASLDIAAIYKCAVMKEYHPLGKFPELTRDLAVALPKGVPAAEVESKIRSAGGKLLQDVRLFDLYEGAQLGENQKSLAYALTWRSEERTLKDEDVESYHQEIEKQLADAFGGVIRGRATS